MAIIEDFLKQYNKELDFYQKLAQIVMTAIEEKLSQKGIKAIVSGRAKNPERLKDKLNKRNPEKQYKSFDDIYADIVDLCGVRIALYFPNEREVMQEVIAELFDVKDTIVFKGQKHVPKYEKRFSGYWATHYRIKVKSTPATKRYTDTLVEIQVASVLMHAWSEVEHDLVYKPFSGDLSREELAILDEINGLVLTGEIALERLQHAIAERTRQQNEITSQYQITNLLFSLLTAEQLQKLKLGDTQLLTAILKSLNKVEARELTQLINQIDITQQETVTDQLVNLLLSENYQGINKHLKKYFELMRVPKAKVSGFELFVKCWIILEEAVKEWMKKYDLKSSRYMVPDFGFLVEKNIITQEEAIQLKNLRRIRNQLMHGIEKPEDDYLSEYYTLLRSITGKLVTKLPAGKEKTRLSKELKELDK